MQSDQRDALSQLYRRLHDSSGEQVRRELSRLDLSFRTFSVNLAVLLKPVDWFENTFVNELLTPAKRDQLVEFCYEIVRHFQNTISAGQAFLDHCETTVKRRYRKDAFLSEFNQERQNRIQSSDVCMFVEELRGAGLHRDSITPSYSRSLSQTGPWTQVHINTDAIRSDDRWEREHPEAARYLLKVGRSLDIKNVMSEYFEEVRSFAAWLQMRIEQIEASALAGSASIQAEIDAVEQSHESADASVRDTADHHPTGGSGSESEGA